MTPEQLKKGKEIEQTIKTLKETRPNKVVSLNMESEAKSVTYYFGANNQGCTSTNTCVNTIIKYDFDSQLEAVLVVLQNKFDKAIKKLEKELEKL